MNNQLFFRIKSKTQQTLQMQVLKIRRSENEQLRNKYRVVEYLGIH